MKIKPWTQRLRDNREADDSLDPLMPPTRREIEAALREEIAELRKALADTQQVAAPQEPRSYKTFDQWAKKQGFTDADLAGPLHELAGCWEAAQRAVNTQQVAVPQGWTDDQMNRFAWSCINPSLGADSIRERLHAFREQEALRGIAAPHPPQELKPLTDAEIESAIAAAVGAGKLSWLGFKKDGHGLHTIPVLSPMHYQIARAIEAHHGIGKHYAFKEVRVE